MDASKSNGGPILIVVPGLGPNGAAKQVSLLAPELAQMGHPIQLAALGAGDMFADALSAIPVQFLEPRWPAAELWRLISELNPRAIHAWRGALRPILGIGLLRR